MPEYLVETKKHEELRRQLNSLENTVPSIKSIARFESFAKMEKKGKKQEVEKQPAAPKNDDPASDASDTSYTSDTTGTENRMKVPVRTFPRPPATVKMVRERRPLSHI